jgi:glutaredoxin-like protein
MLVKDGMIDKMFIEQDVPGDPYKVSDADTMLAYISPNAVKPLDVTLFTKPGCPFCARAKSLLTDNGITYEEIVLGREVTIRSVRAATGVETVPQIFIGGTRIGGSEELQTWLNARERIAA